jgi:hypothetical protein
MRFVRKRPWCLASIALGLAAIAFETSAKRSASEGMTGIAKATQARAEGAPLQVGVSMRQRATGASDRSAKLGLIDLCVAAGSAACLYVSIRKSESRWNSIPAVILIAYVLWLLVLV